MGSDETVPEALRQQQPDGLGGDLGALAGGGVDGGCSHGVVRSPPAPVLCDVPHFQPRGGLGSSV